MDQFNIGDVVAFWLTKENGIRYMAHGTIVEKPDDRHLTISWNAKDEKNCPISGIATVNRTAVVQRV